MPDRKKLILVLVLAGAAGLMVYRAFLTPAPQPARSANPPRRASQTLETPIPATPGAPARRGPATSSPELTDPALRLDLLAKVQAVKYEGSERNIFQFYTPPSPSPPQPVKSPLKPSGPAAPPPPPAIPLKFYGFASQPGATLKKAFLSDGEDIFIAGEGEVVKRRYKILRIGVNTIEIEDLETHSKQSLPLPQEQ